MYDQYAHSVADTVFLSLPEGHVYEAGPHPVAEHEEFGDYVLDSSVKDRTLIFNRKQAITRKLIMTDHYQAYRGHMRRADRGKYVLKSPD